MNTTVVRWRLLVEGTIQGVGFRPFVFRTARRLGLSGFVQNTAAGVLIEAEGPAWAVAELRRALTAEAPPLARVQRIAQATLEPSGRAEPFVIVPSAQGAAVRTLAPPDTATCADCRREIFDASDRRRGYAFTNCTACGPRFTIIRGLPYDRALTTMAEFALCTDCSREYHDPLDRRFHAQPTACPRCGPQAWYEAPDGRRCDDWAARAAGALLDGATVAIKGLGGFHLAVGALDAAAVARLRRRKQRPHRPLAVMARDLAAAARYCLISPAEALLLQSPAAPIVLLPQRPGAPLPGALAPGLTTLGVMLPYTPLHLLLFAALADSGLDLLVLTSGNRSNLPIAHTNAAARRELGDVADGFVLHNRSIANRADDSVVRLLDGRLHFLRRSRGYVPLPLAVPVPPAATGPHPVSLGAGGEMKNACCLIKDGQAFMGPHAGGMETLEGLDFFSHNLQAMTRFLDVRVDVVGYDPHPGYAVSEPARKAAPVGHAVQHHHAHLAAVLAENGRTGPALGLILDGTGYGDDGHLWGGEILLGDLSGAQRLAHMRYVPLPGGERAIRHPWLSALACLYTELGVGAAGALAKQLFAAERDELAAALRLLQTGFNTPLSSGAGRLFDAVAAVAGVCLHSTYEGQAAVELSELTPQEADGPGAYPYRLSPGQIDLLPAVAAAARQRLAGAPAEAIALAWHRTVAAALAAATVALALRHGVSEVGLSGGVLHNPFLALALPRRLQMAGLTPLLHRDVPPGDGGLALGQAVAALWRAAQVAPDARADPGV